MSLSMGEMSILYLVLQTGSGTFMPSDLIFAEISGRGFIFLGVCERTLKRYIS